MRHADRIPPREAARIISELQSYPTWALEVALLCRVSDYNEGELKREAAEKLNILDYMDLAEQCDHHWPANDYPSVLKSKVNERGEQI